MFSCQFFETFKNKFFQRTPPAVTSGLWLLKTSYSETGVQKILETRKRRKTEYCFAHDFRYHY